jgi:membrane-associated phospholipid phosphatase
VKRRALAIAFGVLLLAVPSRARGQDVHELRENVPVSVGIVVTGVGLIIGSEYAKQDLAPRHCRWCDRDDQERDTLNPIDRTTRGALKWNDMGLATKISDLLGFVVSPTAGITMLGVAAANEQAERKTGSDVLIVMEAMAFSGMANQLTKFTVGRERPYAHFRAIGDTPMGTIFRDENLSFFSGHTAQTFTIAAASSTVAFLRGYELAPVVALTTVPIAAITGYLRIAADKHYLTDVLAGMVAGSAFGILVPVLFHPRRNDAAAASPTAAPTTTQVFSFGGVF